MKLRERLLGSIELISLNKENYIKVVGIIFCYQNFFRMSVERRFFSLLNSSVRLLGSYCWLLHALNSDRRALSNCTSFSILWIGTGRDRYFFHLRIIREYSLNLKWSSKKKNERKGSCKAGNKMHLWFNFWIEKCLTRKNGTNKANAKMTCTDIE